MLLKFTSTIIHSPSPIFRAPCPLAKAEGTPLTAASYSPALKSAASAGDWQAAISAIDTMTRAALANKKAGPDVVCFNYAMAACAKAGEYEVI